MNHLALGVSIFFKMIVLGAIGHLLLKAFVKSPTYIQTCLKNDTRYESLSFWALMSKINVH